MTFSALLIKELRLRLRRERTMWIIIVYILLMGFLGWFYLSRFSTINGYGPFGLANTGISLYTLLSQVQLFLILFITPAFTATAINGEKERQTFDLLLCSRLTSFSLIAGKLVAGLTNAFMLVAAALPLFSLVFFFGGISPQQVIWALLVYISTTVMVGSCGLLLSTLLNRPAVSTAVTYMIGLAWLILPIILYVILLTTGNNAGSNQPPTLFIWNPIIALLSTYTVGSAFYFSFGSIHLSPWISYIVLCLTASVIFILLSMKLVRPGASTLAQRNRLLRPDKPSVMA
jgi:ABC-type transport system involved in multi-copper enzyme maturation permease subunit